MSARDSFVYRIYDGAGNLLYVGCTNSLTTRWNQHCRTRPGLKLAAARCKVSGPYQRPIALSIERQALIAERPLLGHIPGAAKTPERISAEHAYTELPLRTGPKRTWYRFHALPLQHFDGWWRCFSDGKPTSLVHDDDMDDWEEVA